MSQKTNPLLTLSAEEMKEYGYKVVDILVDHFENLSNKTPVSSASREEMDNLLLEAIPNESDSANDVLNHVMKNVIPHSDLTSHPKFFSFVPSPSNYISTMADTLATGFNIFTGGWTASPGAAEIEIVTINWLLELFGFPVKDGGGLYTSGGSMANITGLVAARHNKLDDTVDNAIVYMSDQAHSSNNRAARLLGFSQDQIRFIPSDDKFQMQISELEKAIQQDLTNGKVPFCILATAGTTNTGSVDPLTEIATLCKTHNMWMHVDAAYGGGAILAEKGKIALSGIELADSITVDPHKWFFQPYEIGCVLVRDHKSLSGTFNQQPEYLRDIKAHNGEINFFEHGVQLTRRFRALKFYMSIKTFGLNSFREAVQMSFDLSEKTEEILKKNSNWEILAHANLATINFRYNPSDISMSEEKLNELNDYISKKVIATCEAMLATTVLKNKVVLRMCLINPRTTLEDVQGTLQLSERLATEYLNK